MKICIQAGHINVKNNSIVALRGSTGAPGEQELNLRIANRLSSVLRDRGFEVKQTDACANDDKSITSQDWDLFLALHGDSDYAGDNGSGFADFPEPSTDGATAESQRICTLINQSYFPEVKINYVNHSNANTRYYYMWKYLSAKTPCVLLEMGQVQDPHDKVLLANTDLIANGIGRAICKAFNVNFDSSPIIPPIGDTLLSLQAEITRLNGVVGGLNSTIVSLKQSTIDQLAMSKADCQKKLDAFKASLLKIINETI
jgi:N-acetylmuramoyl-L-alanine amidase